MEIEWEDCSAAHKISDSEKEVWIANAIRDLRAHPDQEVSWCRSGDTKIEVSGCADDPSVFYVCEYRSVRTGVVLTGSPRRTDDTE